MAGFGGSIKLTGENEYKNALKQINQSLREVSSSMQLTKTQFDSSDKSTTALAKAQAELSEAYNKQKKDVESLRSAYNSFSEKVQTQVQNHQKLVSEYEKEKAELDRLGKTLGTTSKEYQDQKAKVEELSQKVATSEKNTRDNEMALSKMAVALNKAETELVKTSKEMDTLGKETQETEKEVKGAGEGFTVFKGIMADLGSKAIQSAISGLKKLGTAMLNVGKQAISSYADYEQLVGGVETLFKDSSKIVQNYANEAYKTAGLSANQYMETVTSFSASLLQSLGKDTKKASEYANRAVIDMSDNANKMGTDMTMIQNAYQGFAKQNYTMLDNLKLGYGGTKTEMQRLIQDASKMTEVQKELGLTVDSSSMSFGNIVNAISVMQQSMGIAGTTSKEASETISGSMNSMKSAWQNLLTGIADGEQEVGPLVDKFVDSVITASKNLIPRITEVMDGFKEVIKAVWEEVLPQLEEEIPELKPLIDAFQFIINNGPIIISTLAGIVAGLTAFKVAGMITTLVTGFQTFFTTIQAGQGIMAGLNAVMAANPFGLIALAVAGLVTAFITLWNTSEGFRNFWIGLWENIKSVVSTAINFITGVFNTVITFIKGNWQNLLLLLANPFLGAFKLLYDNCEGFRNFIDNLVTNIVNTISTFATNVKNKAIEIGTNFVNSIVNFFDKLPDRIKGILALVILRVGEWTVNMVNKAKQGAKNTFDAVVNGFKELPNKIMNIGRNIVEGLWNGISNAGNWIKEKVGNFARGILDGMKNALGIHSPSKLFEDQVGKNIALGIGEGFTNEMGIVARDMQNAIPTNFDTSTNLSGNAISGASDSYSYNNMVLAFQEALASMKIELDDEEAGRFVRRTVEEAIYT